MLIIGIRFFAWRSGRTPQQMSCEKCGAVANFILKKGMRFITIFFIPVIPVSGVKQMMQCPNSGTRYQAA